MRILYFTRDYSPHDHRFLSALAATPHQVFSLRLERRGSQLEDRPLPEAVTQVHWRGGQKPVRWQDGPALWLDLKRVIREVKPDIIHAGPIPTVGLLAALSGFQPLVSMSWGSDLLVDADRNWRWTWAARYALAHSTMLLGDCLAVQQKATSLGFPQERTVLFPWGVDLTHFSPGDGADFRDRRGWQDAFVLISVRSWEPIYGVDVLARAFVLAAAQLPGLRLILLGGGSQAAMLRRIFEQGGVSDRVFIGGRVGQRDLPAYYRAADCYVSTSHSDGSSVSLMEALACGCPALVSDIPGNREWVTPGQQGWWFPDGDADALASKILQAAIQRQQLGTIKKAARKLAEERADWNENSKQILRAYQRALELKHP